MRGLIAAIGIALCLSWIGPTPAAHAGQSGTTEIRVAVLLVNFTHRPSEPWSKQFVRDTYFGPAGSVAAYYDEVSNGSLSVSGNVFGYLTVEGDTSRCASKAWGSAARAAASAAQIDLSSFSTVVYAFAYQRACWWAGLARGTVQSGRGDNWINGMMNLYVASHELGHSLGLDHAGSMTCRKDGVRVSFSATCRTYAYGDPFDPMGFTGQRLFHAWHRWELGLLGPAKVATVTQPGTYRIAPAAIPSDEPRMVRIPMSSGNHYALEYRQPHGAFDDFPADAQPVNGISIRIVRDDSSVATKLVDTTPHTCTFYDAPLIVGQTFVDSINDIAITTVSAGPQGAEVMIDTNYQGPAEEPTAPATDLSDAEPPGSPGSVVARLTTGNSVAVNWSAATDDTGIDHYVVTRNGAVVGRTCDIVLENIAVVDARGYEFMVWAVDLAGRAGPVGSVTMTTPDLTPPSSARRVRASATSATTIGVRWKGASDNTAVRRYRLHRNGTHVADLGPSKRSFVDQGLANGTYQYKVTAMDANGNASVPVKVYATLP